MTAGEDLQQSSEQSRWKAIDLGDHQLWIALLRIPASLKDTIGVSSFSTRRRRSRIRTPSKPKRGEGVEGDARRIALTGTPVENHLGDLWSIFDFINPGLFGNARQFTRYTKSLAERATQSLRSTASTGGPLHPAADEDRQVDHRRSAR